MAVCPGQRLTNGFHSAEQNIIISQSGGIRESLFIIGGQVQHCGHITINIDSTNGVVILMNVMHNNQLYYLVG